MALLELAGRVRKSADCYEVCMEPKDGEATVSTGTDVIGCMRLQWLVLATPLSLMPSITLHTHTACRHEYRRGHHG